MEKTHAQAGASPAAKDKSSEKLVGAKEALKQKLLRAVMKQAMEEIGTPENIAERVMSGIDRTKPPIPTAARHLHDLLLGEVAQQAIASMSDVEATAREIAGSVSLDQNEIQTVIQALRDQLTESISKAAISTLADAELTATELAERVSIGRPEIQNIVQVLRERITAAIRQDVLRRFESTDEVADRIGTTISPNEPAFKSINDALVERFLGRIQDQAIDRLSNIEQHAATVRARMDDEPAPVVAIADRLKDILTDEARERTLKKLKNIDALVGDVMETLGDNLEAVSQAAEHIRESVVDEISARAKNLIANVDDSAKSARQRIGADPVEVVEASHRLKEILIQEIARRSADGVRQDDNAINKALSMVDLDENTLVEIREGIKKRILTQVLSSAIAEIHEEVAEAAQEVGFDLKIEDVVFDFGSDAVDGNDGDVASLNDLLNSDDEDALDDVFDSFEEKKSPVNIAERPEDTVEEVEKPSPTIGFVTSGTDDTEASGISESEQVSEVTLTESTVSPAPATSFEPVSLSTAETTEVGPTESATAEYRDVAAEDDREDMWKPLGAFNEDDDRNASANEEGDDRDNLWTSEEPEADASTSLMEGRHGADEKVDAEDAHYPAVAEAPRLQDLDEPDLYDLQPDELELDEFDVEHPVSTAEEEEPRWVPDLDVEDVHVDATDAVNAPDEIEPHVVVDAKASDSDDPVDTSSELQDNHVPEAQSATVHDDSEWAPKPAANAPSNDVYYVYGILATAGPALDGPIPLGIGSGKVEGIDFDGLSAMISRVPASEFAGAALKGNLKDSAWLQENVRKHASIIEQLRARQTVLPMAFCTVYPDRKSIVRLLENGYDSYFDSLEHVDGKHEWGVRIYRKLEVLHARVDESDRRLEGAFSSISKSVVSYLRGETNRMNGDRENAIKLMTDHCTQRSHESLLAISADGKANPDRGGHPRPDEDVVLNVAYLVSDERERDIRSEIERLQAEYAELGFRFELTGPWPPYHFVSADKARDAVRSQQ